MALLPTSILQASSSNQKLRVGVIGLGTCGLMHLQHALEHPNLHVAAICDENAQQIKVAQQMCGTKNPAVFTGSPKAYQALIAAQNIDLVLIATPYQSHYMMAREALLSGKHVACELVMGETVEEHIDIVRIAKQQNLQYSTLDDVLYRPDVMAVKQAYTAGLLGGIKFSKAGYRGALTQSLHGNYPVHALAATSSMHASPITTLSIEEQNAAVAINKFSKQLVPRTYITRRDVTMLVLTHEDQTTSCLQASHDTETPFSIGLQIKGEKGTYTDILNYLQLSTDTTWGNAAAYFADNAHPAWQSARSEQENHAAYLALDGFVQALLRKENAPHDVVASATCSVVLPLAEKARRLGVTKIAFPQFNTVV